MQCEMCGRQTSTQRAVVEGTTMNVCRNCVKFGRPLDAPAGKGGSGSAPRVAEGLARRERRMGGGRDVFANEQMDLELVEDFNDRIRTARERKDWTRQQLGSRIKEPENAVAQFEAGTLHPTDQVAKRLERELGIQLFEKVSRTVGASPTSASRGLTLGDMIKDERTEKDE